MIHILKLQPQFFESIKNGTKKMEIRLYDKKRQLITVGDTIIFKKEPKGLDSLVTVVEALFKYPTFTMLLEAFPVEWFGVKDKKELLSILYNFYSREDENKYGVVGIKIKKL